MSMRVGHGYDVHKLVKNRKLVIGGVHIPFDKGLYGHSDADVLLHAISDALLGAAALGDIGGMFPDDDPEWKDANSMDLLENVVRRLKEEGFVIENIDSTILAQKPKMKPYIAAMCANISNVCRLEVDCVSVKATTEEGLGFTGAGDGIAAHAVCLLHRE